MKKAVIIPNKNKDTELSVTKKIVAEICESAKVYIEEKYASSQISDVCYFSEFPKDADLIIVVGGDGSLIDASILAIEYDIPLVGVNLGKLGYLSEVEVNNIKILKRFFDGKYKVEEKMLLSVCHVSNNKKTFSNRFAVNDITISREAFLGIADFKLENAVGESVRYRADGMILSTPAGSTAYSLSAGGPIISHDIESIVATPICPHSFFNRSIIFKANENIKLKNIGSTDLNITVDGRRFETLTCGDECVVTSSEKRLKIITFSDNNMFSTLFKKMRILEDIE